MEVAMNHPDFPKGMVFDVGGILVPNGESVTLDEDQEQSFVARNRAPVKDRLAGNPMIKVTGSSKFSSTQVEKMFPEPTPVVPLKEEEPPQDEGKDK